MLNRLIASYGSTLKTNIEAMKSELIIVYLQEAFREQGSTTDHTLRHVFVAQTAFSLLECPSMLNLHNGCFT